MFAVSKTVGVELDDKDIEEIEYQMNQFLLWFYIIFYGKKDQYLFCVQIHGPCFDSSYKESA